MQMLCILVCVYVFHYVSAAGGTGDVPTTPNPLACDLDGTITYTHSKADVKSVTTSCGNASLDHTEKTVTITGCPVEQTATIHLYDTDTTPVTGTVKDPDIALTCIINNEEYKAHVSFSKSGTPIPVTAKLPIQLTMSLYNTGTETIPPNVVIGTQYDLKITGAGDHFMKIKSCQADVDEHMRNPVTVYTAKNDTEHIMTLTSPTPVPSSGTDKHPLLVQMTGFRLVKSTSVYLQCTIHLCDKPCPSSVKRKRNKAEMMKANLQFQVIGTNDQFRTSDATEIHAAGRLMVTLGIAAVARYLFQ